MADVYSCEKDKTMKLIRVIREKFNKKKDSNNEGVHNLIYILKPLTAAEYCTGVFRYCIRDGEINMVTMKMKAYSIILFCFILIFYFFDIIRQILDTTMLNGDRIAFTVYAVLCFFNVAHFFKHLVTFDNHCKRNIKVVKSIMYVDNMLQNHLKKPDLSRNKLCFVIIAISVLPVFTYLFDYIASGYLSFCEIYLYFIDFKRYIAAISFSVYCNIVTNRLAFIYDELQSVVEMLHSVPRRAHMNVTISISEQNKRIQTLAMAFDTVVSTLIKINKMFNITISLILMNSFLVAILLPIFTFNVYDLYRVPLISSLLYFFLEISFVSVVYISPVMILSKKNSIKVLLNELVIDDNIPSSTRLQCKAFLDIVNVSPMVIKVYEMFTLNAKCILKFFSITTAYFILFIQVTHAL